MPLIQDLSQAQLVFQIEGMEPDRFSVLRYRGNEGLCQLYRFEIELSASPEAVAFDDIVGKPAALSINADFGQRWFHGVVGRFELKGESPDTVYYRAELVPALWLLTHRYNSRIFQQKTVKEIIIQVLTDGGIASDRFDLAQLQGEYQPREYCVQYRETDYNFIGRLMEEEGIRWFFRQTEEAHILVLADAPDYLPIEGDPVLPYVAPAAMNVSAEHVFRFRLGSNVRPGAVVLRDFNFEKPPLDLECTRNNGRDLGFEFSDYPGEYREQGAGKRLADVRMEEFEASRILGVGQTNSSRLSPGCKFELTEYAVSTANRGYLVTTITHEGKQAVARTTTDADGRGSVLESRVHQALLQIQRGDNTGLRSLAEAVLQLATRLRAGDATAHRALTHWLYHAGQVSRDLSNAASVAGRNPLDPLAALNLLDDPPPSALMDFDAPVYTCRFECIPADVVYRPPRVTPWPVMRGSQTARVVGPEGEEIHTDKYGRVKVQFNWDREGKFNENASCWIRVSQGLAGGNYGIMFLPRVGQEVVVDFLEGDPDQPIITGRVYNADHMPPYTLPDEKTKSCIKTNSSTGGGGTNEIRFEDLKDKEQILIHAQKDLHVRVTNDDVENIEHDRHLTVANDKFEQIERDKSVHVKGKESYQVDGTLSVSVASDVVEAFKANHKHEVTSTYAVKGMNIKLEGATGIELKCGGSSIVLTPAAIFIVGGPLVNINSGSGPPVSPVSASATTPGDLLVADDVTPGKDTRYGGGKPPEPAEPKKEEKKKTSWIEIEMVDEADQPVPGEPFELKTPDAKIIKGSLDANGFARVDGIEPGTCLICFYRLDAEAWERI